MPITTPEEKGPFPAVINMGFFPAGSLPPDIFTSRRIATIHYMESQITNGWSNVRGDGFFFELSPDITFKSMQRKSINSLLPTDELNFKQ